MKDNSTYSKLLYIQQLAKSETSQKNIILKVKESHLDNIKDISQKIIEQKLNIASIADNLGSEEEVKYFLQSDRIIFPFYNSKVYAEPFLFNLRENQEKVFQLLTHCETNEEKKAVASFFINFFYGNSFSSEPIENELLLMLYRTIDHEISSLNSNQPEQFLNDSINLVIVFNSFIN